MEIYIYKLKFLGPTHFGETGIDLENISERLSSDSLFSALINALYITSPRKEADDFLKEFNKNPPFIISSLFLYKGETYFLPRPKIEPQISEGLKKEKGKDLKKIKWVDVNSFRKWYSGIQFNEKEIDSLIELKNYYKNSYILEVRPRVTLDRNTKNSEIYHCGYIYFKEDAGLYGLIAFQKLDYFDSFKSLLMRLGQIGLGGEKTYGCGMFNLIYMDKIQDFFKPIFFRSEKYYILLSLYHPNQDEIYNLSENAISYDIIRSKGWITSGRYAMPIKRKSIGFFTEGSVFLKKVKGCLVDVTPESLFPDKLNHKVYRYGFAFTAPIGGF